MHARISLVAAAGAIPPLVALCNGPAQQPVPLGVHTAALPNPTSPAGAGRAAPKKAVSRKRKAAPRQEDHAEAQVQASGCLRWRPGRLCFMLPTQFLTCCCARAYLLVTPRCRHACMRAPLTPASSVLNMHNVPIQAAIAERCMQAGDPGGRRRDCAGAAAVYQQRSCAQQRPPGKEPLMGHPEGSRRLPVARVVLAETRVQDATLPS